MAQLEQRVGHPLVHRSTRRLALSERGLVFLERVRSILREVDAARIIAQSEEPQGTIRVSVPVPLGRLVGGPVIAAFRQRLPAVRLDIRLWNNRVDLIRDGFDLAIRGGPLPDSELLARRLAEVPMLLYVSAQLDKDLLSDLPFIAAPGDVALLRKKYSIRVEPVVLIDDRVAISDALEAGAGIGILPAFLGEPLCSSGHLRRWDAAPVANLPVHAVFLPSQRDDRRVHVLMDTILEHLRALLERGQTS